MSSNQPIEFTIEPSDLKKHRLNEDNRQRWIVIQVNTFTNWLNEQLGGTNVRIRDLSKDFKDGISLIQLVEVLQQRKCKGRIFRHDASEIQMIMNVQMALDALKEDGVKMVNIGAHDIVEGNMKLILGLVWCLIQRYQINAHTKIPAKKLMMAWLQSVLPELKLTNFHSNWNDGRALSALLEYCQPGLYPDWQQLRTEDALENCERAIGLADRFLNIPPIISPGDMSSTELDELSCITYLSYFMKYNGPGYRATLERVRQMIPNMEVDDFEDCWKDGTILCALVEAAGGCIAEPTSTTVATHAQRITNIHRALNGASKLGVNSLVGAEDIADPRSDHLGIMALASALCSLSSPSKKPIKSECLQNQQVNLDLAFSKGSEVDINELDVVVSGPTGIIYSESDIQLQKSRTINGAVLSIIPIEIGLHKIRILCQGTELPSSPIVLQVHSSSPRPEVPEHNKPMDYYPPPDIGHVSFSGLSEPCSIGSIVEVVINAHGDSSSGAVLVEAVAPSGRLKKCQVLQKANSFTATFTPNEVGEWRIGILYDGDHIRGSPFSCNVYDANLVQVYGLDVGLVGQELKFSVNASQAGEGFVKVTVLRHGRALPCEVREQANSGVFRVSFTPDGAGQYKIHVLFNNMEVKGSPFILDIADASSVSVYGENLRMASVDRLSTFMIHAVGADCKDITVTVTAPSGKKKYARVFQLDDVSYKVEWKAVEAGEHSIDVRLFNQSVYESPFVCNVGDPDLVSVRNMPEFIAADQLYCDYTFEIDASAAGSGNLEIMINGGRVACRVRELGGRHYLAAFTPTQAITHIVEMRFNGEDVRLSPWKIPVKSTRAALKYDNEPPISRINESKSVERRESYYSELSGAGLQRAAVGKVSIFEISGNGLEPNDIQARIFEPGGEELPIKIYRSGGKLFCEYRIRRVGEHRLEMSICGKKIDPFPLYVSGYSSEKVKIEPLGGGAPGQPVQFVVDAVDAGKGQLEISVNQGKVPNNVQMQGAGRCLVTFIPQYPGKYVIDVTFNGEQVQGCPIRVDILPKQVGQSITTPIVSHQTATITSTAYKSDSLTRSGEPSTHSPTSPTLIRHLRQRSSDQLTPEHPRSPILVRKAESKIDSRTALSSRLESTTQQSLSSRPWTSSLTRLTTQSPTTANDRERLTGSLERPKKTEGYDASIREEDISSLSEREGSRLGYTVAQYGGEPPQTVSNRTYTDDGKGTVTSTFTSETRYSAVSPARTFEYSKGTLSSVADEGRTAMPTTYSETRVHESPKPSQVTAADSAIDAHPSISAIASRDHVDSKVVSKKPQIVEYSNSSFVTDSRSYGVERSRSTPRDVPITSETLKTTDRVATPLRYFGDELKDEKKVKEEDSGGSDVAMITTTYERYRSISRENVTDGARFDSTPYTRSTFDPAKIRADSRSVDLKDSAYTAASYGTTDYREAKSPDDRYDRFPSPPPPPPPPINEPPVTVLERVEELPMEPKNWSDYVAQERREQEKRAEAEAYRREYERRSLEVGFEEEETRRQAEKRIEKDAFRREEALAKDGWSRPEGGREYEKQVERDAYLRGESWKAASSEGRDPGKLSEEDAYRGGRGQLRTDWTRSSRDDEREREKYVEKEAYRRERGRELDFERSAEEQAYGREGGVGWEYENPTEAEARRRDQLMRAVKSEGYQVEHNEPPFLRTQSEFDAQKTSGRVADLREYYTTEARVIGEIPVGTLTRDKEIEPTPLLGASQRTAEYMRTMEEDEKIFERHGLVEPSRSNLTKLSPKSSIEVEEPEGNIPTNVIEELTPRTRRKIDTQTLRREEDLDETLETMKEGVPAMQTLDRDEQLAHSQPPTPSITPKSTPKTTPKLGLKFGKETKEQKDQKVFDFGKSKFTSKHEVVRRGKDVDVKLESLKLSKDDQLRIVVIPPAKANGDRTEIDPKVKKSRHTYEISFKPTEVGTHKVMAYVNGVVHPLSPFPIRVYDASEIIVGEITPQSTINDTVEFTVDAGRAGFGNLEMAIKDSNDTIIPSHVAQLESGTAKFLVTFNPTSLGMHTVNITFNKEVLKNSPFEVNIVEAKTTPETIALEGKKKDAKKEKEEKKREEKEKLRKEKEEKQMAETLKRSKAKDSKKKKQVEKTTSVTKIPSLSRVGKRAQIFVSVAGDELLDVAVLDPLKNTVDSEIMEHEPGVKRVEFTPTVVGDHEIDIKYGDADVQGSPFTCRAYDPAKIVVANIPNGAVDKAVHFIVDASEAGVGNLEVAVNEGRIPSMAQSLGQHRYDISFVPREQIDHTISVRFNNEPVPGSPFVCRLISPRSITASGSGLERIPVGQIAEFYITVEGDKGTAPKVRIMDSQGDELLVKVAPSERDPDQFIVQYTPKCVGNHQVEVEYDGEPITGSPFTSKAFDATCARLSRVDDAQVGRPCTFTIDAARAGAGNMEIIVSVENRNVPNFVQAEGQAKFKVSFTPQEAKEHIISVRFNGQPIPGSPMSCPVAAKPSQPIAAIPTHVPSSTEQQIRIVGDLSTGQVGQVKGFTIDTAGRSVDCNVLVTDSKGNNLDVQLEKVLNGYHIQFVPRIPGEHDIEVELDGRPLGVGPFVMNVNVAPKITRLPSIVIAGKKLAFELETGRRTGENDVRIEVRDEDGRSIPVHTEDDGQDIVRASCRVRDIGRHSVELFVDGKPCGERRYVDAIDASSGALLINEIERARVGEPIRIALRVENGLSKHLAVSVSDPERNQIPVSLQSVSNDVFEVEFIPNSEGDHQLSVKIADAHVRGSPFKVTVLDLSAVRVIGLKNDRVGVEQRFNVDWSNSGGVEATVRVTRDGLELPCTIKKVKPGLHVCSFTPKRAGLHLVDVMIDDVLLPECPYECIVNDVGSVRARGDALTRAQRGKTARFEVSMWNAGRGELDVLIADSRGTPLPVRCYKQQDDSYWVEFTPEHIGGHKIEITFADIPVAGSPFRCEVVDPKKVFIKGISEPLTVRQAANITVDRESAGNGELTIEVTDPTGQILPIDIAKSPSGEDQISFLPVKLGQYKINAKLSGFQVQGMPQTLLVEEQAKPMLYGSAIERAVEIDQPTSVVFDAKKLKGSLKVDVRGPKKIKVRHTANKRADGTTEIVFTPNEVGRYTIDVEFNNRAVGGSPFDVEVLDPHKVVVNDETADDNGVIHLAVQQRNIIDVDATAAGSGKLRAEVRDWDGKLVAGSEVESLGYGKYRVMFNPPAPGKYNIYLYWSEIAVQSAYPLHTIADAQQPSTSRSVPIVTASDSVRHMRTKSGERSLDEEEMSDHLRVVLRGEGLTRAACKEQSEFIIDGSDTSREGRVNCSLIGQKADVPVRLTHLGNNVYKAVYTPLISGTYELQVMWDGRHVRGSPFRVQVESHASAAELIHVDTNTLKIGIINDDVKTLIDTRRAGPGQLSAQCMGPSKLAYCELYDHRDGTYTLSVRPSEVGKHTLVVKYSDEHVPGSPFVINVSHPPDASKVRVFGPGIEHGILSTFKSNFIVETKGAGAGQLTVRVRGPKGAFNVEMQREKKQERTIHCKYEPREPGDYQVEVKWHGEHVPGSPFLVMIVDTEQELQRFLRGDAPSPQPATPFIPPGWIGAPPPPLFLGGPPPGGPRPPFPPAHPALPPPPPHGPHGPLVPYGPPLPHTMRSGGRSRFANGY